VLEEVEMPEPDLPVVAQGEAPGGRLWSLRAAGSADRYYSMLRTVHPNGHWDEGGMGGPALPAGSLFNVYTGRADDGPLRVIVRTDLRVRRLRVHLAQGDWCDLRPASDDPVAGVTVFAILIPGATGVDEIHGFDADGQLISE
jgi:hypothetical protein